MIIVYGDQKMTKFLVITGGVISGIGKGITASSIGFLLQARGYKVTAIKIDPYLNQDAGTMSPSEHGECYVLDDGAEVDLDLGNYERFLDIQLTADNSITTGKIYRRVLDAERAGAYLGKTIQIQPHIVDEVLNQISLVIKPTIDFCIIEIGGTVDDMENLPILEAIRQLSLTNQVYFIHVSMIIELGHEYKTRPTQQSISSLRSKGIVPNMLILRTTEMLDLEMKKKLSLFCGITVDDIICNLKVPNIYFVPQTFENQDVCSKILSHWHLSPQNPDLASYSQILHYHQTLTYPTINILIAGKYTGTDQYLSLTRAIEHAAMTQGVKISLLWLNTETMEDAVDATALLKQAHGIIIPGGFGSRGIPGKLKVAQYAREHNIPLLGICLGFQVMIVEFCQHVLHLSAKSQEWSDLDGDHHVITLLPNQNATYGGTMRLGQYTTTLTLNSKVLQLYGTSPIQERHRHRYEFNNFYTSQVEQAGLQFTGLTNELKEIVEYDNHPFYIGCQFHPEFKTKYNKPHPLFLGLISAILQSPI